MADYIERQAAVSRFEQFKKRADTMRDKLYLDGVLAVIDALPAANVREDVQGEWKTTEYPIMSECEDCSVCGYRAVYGHNYKFCPNCGARMTGDGEW